MPSVSLVVPVYNVGNYLRTCLDAILAQTFTDFELILVNDGSTDDSGAICDEYAARDERIMVIHKVNEGAGPTRNAGIASANAEYIAFPDADDWIEPEMLANAYRLAKEHDVDFVMWGSEVLAFEGETLLGKRIINFPDTTYDNQYECRTHFMELFSDIRLLFDSPWSKLYRRSIINENQLIFPQIRRAQDAVFNLDFFNHVTKVVITSAVYYHYRENDQDKVWRKFPRDYIDIMIYYDDHLLKLAKSWGVCGEKEQLFFDRGFVAGVIGAISHCLNPKWKLSLAGKNRFIQDILNKPYIVTRIKEVVLDTREMQRNKRLIQRKKASQLLFDVYTASWGAGLRKNILSRIPIVYAILRFANRIYHKAGA